MGPKKLERQKMRKKLKNRPQIKDFSCPSLTEERRTDRQTNKPTETDIDNEKDGQRDDRQTETDRNRDRQKR